ncbi:uncharacterized protein LOC124256765 isoform X2 [Haliotis rubra]|nr:uncharacterized protein LOC124256765 isoform X2 [Haliotis rubra]XP_046546686.1 uncharacterized protein LOC124256765 isoform X2 [Haliotis rubra]
MSLLTRTKGYFVVICLLMCGFLLTFSWRLLYNTYDSSGLKPLAAKTPLRTFREIAQNISRSRSVVKVGPEVTTDVKDKGQNGRKPFTKDEIGSILSKIHELGLSASEVQEKLLSWQQHPGSFRNSSESSVLPKSSGVKILDRQSEKILNNERALKREQASEIAPERQLASESQRASERARTPERASERERASAREQASKRASERAFEREQASERASQRERTSERALERGTPSVRRNGTSLLPHSEETFGDESVHTGRNKISKIVHESYNNPRSTQFQGSSSDHVNFPTQGKGSHRRKDNTDTRHIRNDLQVKGGGSDGFKVVNENKNLNSGSRLSGSDLYTTSGNKPDQKSKRDKYLLFLKEKFESSKTKTVNLTRSSGNLRVKETGEPSMSRDSHQLKMSDVNAHITSLPSTTTVTVTPKSTSRTSHDLSLFDELKRKYPSFSMDLNDDLDKDLEVDGTQRPDYCAGCFDFNFPILINHEGLCKSSGRSQNLQLLMLISSAPGNYQARSTIRQTWGAKCRDSDTMKCLFVVGLASSSEDNDKILLENDHHGDILQIGFKDSYSNLTYKTVSSLKWASKHCYNANYIMKTDDDMYVNTELIPIMLQAAPRRKFMGGSCWGTSNPNRDTSSKWFVSFKSFHKPKFPPMCSGTGYIMSMDVVRSMLFSSRNVPFFHLEDVYVALCLQKYGILPINIMGFSNMFQEFDACHYRNGVMTSHQVPPELLEEYWAVTRKCPQANIAASQLYIIMPYPDT